MPGHEGPPTCISLEKNDGRASSWLLSSAHSLQTRLSPASLWSEACPPRSWPHWPGPQETPGWVILPAAHTWPLESLPPFSSISSGSATTPTQPARLQFLHRSPAACLPLPALTWDQTCGHCSPGPLSCRDVTSFSEQRLWGSSLPVERSGSTLNPSSMAMLIGQQQLSAGKGPSRASKLL